MVRVSCCRVLGGTPEEHFNFTGGGVELGETLEAGLCREVMEETCLEVSVGRLLMIVESVGSRNTNLIRGERIPWNELRFFFACLPRPGAEARLPDRPDDDQTAVRWVALGDLPKLEVLPAVTAELLAALNQPTTGPAVVPNPVTRSCTSAHWACYAGTLPRFTHPRYDRHH